MEGNNLSVYIVDDEFSIVEWMLNHIEWEVYNCTVAGYSTNAAEALQYIKENKVDLLLTDISMPEMSGLDLIKEVKACFPEMLIIVISAYDKFSYVRDAFQYGIINYCLKPIDENELQECLKSAMMTYEERQLHHYNQDRRVFRDSIFQGLLSGEINALKFREQSSLVGIDFSGAAWQVALMDISGLKEEASIALLKQYRERESCGYYCFLDAYMNLVFILYGDTVSADAGSVQKLLVEEAPDTFFCVGEPLESYRQIAASYEVCRDFLNAGFLFRERLMQTGDYPYESYRDVLKGSELQQLDKALKHGDKDSMLQMIREMEQQWTEEEKRAQLVCLAVFLVNSVLSAAGERERMQSGEYLEDMSSSEQMEKWLEDFCERIVDANEQSNSSMHPCVQYALRQIDTRYWDTTLSMKEIAEKRCMSPAYLGTLFKEQAGELFNEYLMKVRLEKALELLGDNKMTVGAIVTAAGFTSQSYFNRVFRKKFGISPLEYRRRLYEDGE